MTTKTKPKEKLKRVHTAFSLPVQLHHRLILMCEAERRSMANMVETIVIEKLQTK